MISNIIISDSYITKISEEIMLSKPQCSICFSIITFDKVWALFCGHTFHFRCVRQWMKVCLKLFTRVFQEISNIYFIPEFPHFFFRE